MDIPALPFSKIKAIIPKPIKISQLITVGDHIKKKRLELGLFQKDVAVIIGVSEDTITFWENNRVKIEIRYMPRIIQFLAYNPITIDTSTLSGKLYEFRILNGLTYKGMGTLAKVDASTIASLEQNYSQPSTMTKTRLKQVLRN